MRIVQICSGYVNNQCEEPAILGLGDDGAVYLYRDEVKPFQTQEQVMVPASELTVEQMLNAQPVNNTPPAPAQAVDIEPESRGIFRSKTARPKPIVQESEKQDPNGRKIDPKVTHYIIWREIFRDGWTAGWTPLPMTISKPVPHKDDPTRNERA